MVLRGQILTMRESFAGLIGGLVFAMVLVYLLMVVIVQSWVDPLISGSALPLALAGIVWMLFVTGTTLSVPALMGAIMCMGVGTANSVLVITFANEVLEEYKDSYRSALQAGYVRLRPVLMTAIAMIIGMVPMALGLGEGGEQNAPLGRAVIGGLFVRHGRDAFVCADGLRCHPQKQVQPTNSGNRSTPPVKSSLETKMTQGTLKSSEPLKEEPPIVEKGGRKGVKIFFLAGGALFIGIAVLGILSRTAKTSGLQQQSNEAAQVIVNVVHPEKAAKIIPLQLPGQTRAYNIEAPIFCSNQWVSEKVVFRYRRQKVKAGDVLAEIDTPQVDQQFKQAQAQLKVAESARDLANSTFKRDQDLF